MAVPSPISRSPVPGFRSPFPPSNRPLQYANRLAAGGMVDGGQPVIAPVKLGSTGTVTIGVQVTADILPVYTKSAFINGYQFTQAVKVLSIILCSTFGTAATSFPYGLFVALNNTPFLGYDSNAVSFIEHISFQASTIRSGVAFTDIGDDAICPRIASNQFISIYGSGSNGGATDILAGTMTIRYEVIA